MAVSGCLHRISRLENRYGDMCGLTYRIGRHVPGNVNSCLLSSLHMQPECLCFCLKLYTVCVNTVTHASVSFITS